MLYDRARASCPLSSLILKFPGLSGAANAPPLVALLPLAIDLVFIDPDMYNSKRTYWFFSSEIFAGDSQQATAVRKRDIQKSVRVGMGVLKESTRKNTTLLYFFVAVTMLRLELPNIAEVAVYLATHYVQTTTKIVLYGSASLQDSCPKLDKYSVWNWFT